MICTNSALLFTYLTNYAVHDKEVKVVCLVNKIKHVHGLQVVNIMNNEDRCIVLMDPTLMTDYVQLFIL